MNTHLMSLHAGALMTLIAVLAPARAFGQDTLTAPRPFSPADTLASDSLQAPGDTTSSKGIDTMVTYTCSDSIVYDAVTKKMAMYGSGNIRYQKIDLKAERIDLNWNTSTMTAHGVPDSTSDTAKYKGLPVMKDGGEEYHGMELGYNFKTKKGKIDYGDTHLDEGYYHGKGIKKVEPDVLFVENGRYTTCEVGEPHYYFGSPKMKIIMGDKIVAQPVYLYISDVPVFWLPEAVFPAKGGRRSGIIAPALVEDGTYGRLLHHLGYYWAISDYTDMNVRTDLYTKGSWGVASDFRYAKRYDFTGSLSGQYSKRIKGESSDPDYTRVESYQANVTHNQTFDPTTRLNVYFTLASNNSYLNTINQQQLLNQSLSSNATLSKSWEGTPNSVTLNVSRTQDLRNGNTSTTLPSVSFNHSQSYPFRSGDLDEDFEDAAWYENIGFSYGASANNNRASIQRDIYFATSSGLDTVKEYQIDRSQTLTQTVSVNIAPKLGYVTISPFVNYNDRRSFSNNDLPGRDTTTNMVIFVNEQSTTRFGAISSGVSMSTKLYGIVQPGLLGIEALRHTITPSLSLSYNKQIIGDNLPPKQMLMTFNMGNVFEVKTPPPEEGKEGNKFQLLNLNGGISYNFSADSLNFSPIALTYRTGIGDILNLYGGMGLDLYKFEGGRRVNQFTISDGPLARLTDFSIDASTSLAGERTTSSAPSAVAEEDSTQSPGQRRQYYGMYHEEDPDFSIPWRLGVSINYAANYQPGAERHASTVRGNLEFNLTEAWKFTMSGGYDIINKSVVVPNITISRDLHCWLMNFIWVPLGNAKSFQFELRVKAPQLRDLKLTKSGSDRGYYSY